MGGKCYDLRILPLFEEDLYKIIDYITFPLQNPIAADVETAIQERLHCAEAFEPYHSAKKRTYPYYRIPVRNFTVFYVVIGSTMEVRRILYNRRDFERHI